jgi:hypothetical protein
MKHLRTRGRVALTALLASSTFALGGCVYALRGAPSSSQEQIRVIAISPENYFLDVFTGEDHNYPVPPDGKVVVNIPAFRGCDVYFLGVLKVRSAPSVPATWVVSVRANGKTLQNISVRSLQKLSTDAEGYRLLKVRD